MNNEAPVARSSLVPVLGCIALMLFGLNFYRFLDRDYLSKWKFCGDHVMVHRHLHPHEANAFTVEIDRALRVQEHALQRNLERAERELARARRQLALDGHNVDLERLREELEIKRENLEQLHEELQMQGDRLEGWHCDLGDEAQDRHRLRIHIVR